MGNIQFYGVILFLTHCAAAFLGYVGGGMRSAGGGACPECEARREAVIHERMSAP